MTPEEKQELERKFWSDPMEFLSSAMAPIQAQNRALQDEMGWRDFIAEHPRFSPHRADIVSLVAEERRRDPAFIGSADPAANRRQLAEAADARGIGRAPTEQPPYTTRNVQTSPGRIRQEQTESEDAFDRAVREEAQRRLKQKEDEAAVVSSAALQHGAPFQTAEEVSSTLTDAILARKRARAKHVEGKLFQQGKK